MSSTTQASSVVVRVLPAELDVGVQSDSPSPAGDSAAHDTFAPVPYPWLKDTSTLRPGFEVNLGDKSVEVASGDSKLTNPYVIGGSVAAGVAGAATAIGLTAELAEHFQPTPAPTPAPPIHGEFSSYLTRAVKAGDMVLPMLRETGFEVGYEVMIGEGAHSETKEIASFEAKQLRRLKGGSDMYVRLKTPLQYSHGKDTTVQAKKFQVSAKPTPAAAFLKQAPHAATPAPFGTRLGVTPLWISLAVAGVGLLCCLCVGLACMFFRPARKQQKLLRAVESAPVAMPEPFEEMAPLVAIAPTKYSMVAPMSATYAAPTPGAFVAHLAPTRTSSLARAPTYTMAPPGTAI